MRNTRPPSQAEIESELYRATIYSDFTALASWLDCSPSTIARQINPENGEVRSNIYKAIRDLWASCNTRPELFEAWYGVIERYAEAFRGTRAHSAGQLPRLEQRMRQSIFELIGAEIDRLPMRDRIDAIRRAKRDLENFEKGLMLLDIEDAPEDLSAPAS